MSSNNPPAIYFHADAIEGDGKDLVGRRSAGQSFLRGFLQHMPGDVVRAVVSQSKTAEAFDKVARGLGETRPINVRSLQGPHDFTEFDTVFFPAPGFMDATWRRQKLGPTRCSLVGITHTVSTRRVIEKLHTLMLEPVEDWDAIICTSRAVQSVVARQFELEAEYIRDRFGATRVPQPQLPLIPLGIHTSDFAQTPADRIRMRQQLGAPDDAVVILTMGRLTSVEKANPAPLLMALETLAQTCGKPLHLWMAGWASREAETKLHIAAARALAPSVTFKLIDGRKPDMRRHIWAGADIFTLPVDNIQETFGLVPVEAMAAGLPVVMPDWNGFRDTVLHGETGFLVPTAMPGPSPTGDQIAARFAEGRDDYLRYLSLIQQQTAIDVREYRAALEALIVDPALRQQMGAAGQAHARQTFDWETVIPQYAALADALRERREAATDTRSVVNPIEVDPFDLYGGYPSFRPDGQSVVQHVRPLDLKTLQALDAVNGRALYRRRMMPDDQTVQIAVAIAEAGSISIDDLTDRFSLSRDGITGAVLFLAKYDFVALTPQEPN